MVPAAAITFFKPEFGDFLYAPISGTGDGIPTSVMSALARLGLDPWQEAAELNELPISAATIRLSALIASLPQAERSLVDSRAFVTDLIELLPHRIQTTIASMPLAGRPSLAMPSIGRATIFAAIAICLLLVTVAREHASPRNTTGDDTPSTTTEPSRPTSR